MLFSATVPMEWFLGVVGAAVAQTAVIVWFVAAQFNRLDRRLVRLETHLGIDPDDRPRLSRLSPQTRR